ncbi:1-phosphofructokinase family hexose kinase [Rosettibacter firmus]|uniref:1-phosphofructokinase family hexose kinase n=1 Tax=Rosettibacter firmus TaxID=3111522 RepID=UPI00336BF008
MILTVTLNPLLERRLFFNSIELGRNNRCLKETYAAGGKGINVSRQLNFLGIQNQALTFLGGNNGKVLRSILTEERINFSVQSTKSETRLADVIIESDLKRITTFFGENSHITFDEVNEFKIKLEKMIQNSSIVVFSGSSPCKETDDIFPYGIRLANKYDKISILDTYGNHLEDCLNEAPTVVHNNLSEVEDSLSIKLHSEDEIINYLKSLYSKGIKLSFLTDGANQFYAAKFDFIYKISFPNVDVIDSTGSGDAFTAGIAFGLEHSLVFDEFIKIATALGIANATKLATCNVTKEEYEKYLPYIHVESVGKKMKIIDDTPRY